jgi:hypothetical protein
VGRVGCGYSDRMQKTLCRSGYFLVFVLAVAMHAAFGQQLSTDYDAVFQTYTSCRFSDGLTVVETTPLAPGISARTVDTSKGPKQVEMVAGKRVMFAYPGKDFYANVKVEILPQKNYAEMKQTLIDNFDYILASGNDNGRNYSLKPMLHGFDIRGLDRDKMEGGVLGLYLLFDDVSRVVTTIYFLNQDPKDRSFQTMDEYRVMRDKFLDSYTVCVRTKDSKP